MRFISPGKKNEKPFHSELWFILLIVVVALLIVALLILFICIRRRKRQGADYSKYNSSYCAPFPILPFFLCYLFSYLSSHPIFPHFTLYLAIGIASFFLLSRLSRFYLFIFPAFENFPDYYCCYYCNLQSIRTAHNLFKMVCEIKNAISDKSKFMFLEI